MLRWFSIVSERPHNLELKRPVSGDEEIWLAHGASARVLRMAPGKHTADARNKLRLAEWTSAWLECFVCLAGRVDGLKRSTDARNELVQRSLLGSV